ncbi:uncharacterized protein [Triticum aestivum]|uniref:uncharacterized protein n=1 Tax=Triticum aestivum TaxID=4565 RepID=UPI001D02C0B1|nr:uncharacterized protein LOC123049579 [Triticum aestivum]
MAAALQFAARKLCGCALQRPPQPYLTAVAEATIKEERRHGGSTLRRFSTESQNVVKNNKLGAMSEANPAAASPPINNAQATSPPPIWSPRNKMFLPLAAGYITALCAGISRILYYCTHEERGPFFETPKKQSH